MRAPDKAELDEIDRFLEKPLFNAGDLVRSLRYLRRLLKTVRALLEVKP